MRLFSVLIGSMGQTRRLRGGGTLSQLKKKSFTLSRPKRKINMGALRGKFGPLREINSYGNSNDEELLKLNTQIRREEGMRKATLRKEKSRKAKLLKKEMRKETSILADLLSGLKFK